MTVAVVQGAEMHLEIDLRPLPDLSEREFVALCAANPDLRFERTSQGDILIMPPAGGESGFRNLGIGAALYAWSRADGSGAAFDSSTGFRLPNGATRSPDAAWLRRVRLEGLTPEEKRRFLPLCPDFVIELRSPIDRLVDLQAKMEEYLANGLRLGWLIDPDTRVVAVYRPTQPVERLDHPARIAGDPELPGFELDLGEVWEPGL